MVAPFATHPTRLSSGRTIQTFRVVVVAGPAAGTTWTGQADRCSVGSHPSNDLVIDDPTVSRFHCELSVPAPADAPIGERVAVRDLGSRNGIFVDDVLLGTGAVPHGKVLVLGNTHLAIEIGPATVEVPASPRTSFGTLVGASEPMRELFSQLEKVAASDATVLIEGETGTGKEGLAEALHDASARAKEPFVVIDCGAIPANLLESELFGHEAGAFTGAEERRIGVFEQASGGSIFLDEIGELPAELQPKLLRALESREIRPIGRRTVVRCDVRIIAATNRDLRAEVNRGAFRADLYYRLAVVKLRVPPLRERPGDLPLLVDTLVRRIGASDEVRLHLSDPDFVAALATAPWPGNVRELRNHLHQCVVFGERRLPSSPATPHPATWVDASRPYEIARRQAIDAFERDYVTALLVRAEDNVARAAREAGVNRAYLHRLLRRHGLR